MERDQQMKREAITLPEPISERGSYSEPGYYVIDQSGAPVSDRYNTQAEAYANLKGGAGVSYLDQPQGGHLNQPWPPELHTVVGHTEGDRMPQYTEADLLRAMASTNNLEEQRYLMSALEEVRQETRRTLHGANQMDLDGPHSPGEERPFYPYHQGAFGTSSATDWLAEMSQSDDGMPEHMLTMGSRFFIGCHPEVKADPVEYMTQALGVARVAASQFANIEGAVNIFMEHVANLARVDMTKIAVDQLLPWASEPEELPPTDSNYPGPYSKMQNTDVVDEPPLGEAEPLDNGASGRAVMGGLPGIISSHQHMSEFLFDPPTPEELAQASGPGNLNQQYGKPASSEDDSGGPDAPVQTRPDYVDPVVASRRRQAADDDDDDGGDYRYIKHRKGHKDSEGNDAPWVVVQKGTGDVLSSHPSRESAIDGFKAMMRGKHGGSLKCACVEHQGNFVLRDGSRTNRYIDRRQCQVHNGSRAFNPEPTTYEEYLARLAPDSAAVSREFFSGAMAAHSPSANDVSVPAWGRRERPKGSVTERPSNFRGVTQRSAAGFTSDHIQRYMDWAKDNGHNPDELGTLRRYEREPGVGRAHANYIADHYHMEDPDWRQHWKEKDSWSREGARWRDEDADPGEEEARECAQGCGNLRSSGDIYCPDCRSAVERAGWIPSESYERNWERKQRGIEGSRRRRGANEDMLNPQAFERADESDAPSLRGSDGTGTYDQKATWLQSGEAAHEPTGLIPQTDLSENFSNISDFPDTGNAEVPSTRAPNVGAKREAMRWSPASGMGGTGGARHLDTLRWNAQLPPEERERDLYGDFAATHTYNPVGWDRFDQRPHPGSNAIGPGAPVQLHGKMSPDGHLVHIRDEDGNHQTVDFKSITRYRPAHDASVRTAAQDDDDDDEGKETGGPQDKPGAYEPDRSLYTESPEGQAEATRGYEEAYSSGRMIDFTGAGVDQLGTVPVQGYAQDASRPNGEMWPWGQNPVGSPPKGAAEVADVPTAGMISAQETGNSYPQPEVKKNSRLDAWRANIAARVTANERERFPHIDDPVGREFEHADPEDQRAADKRFGMGAPLVKEPGQEGKFRYDPGNWWDGYTPVTKHGPGHYSFEGYNGTQHFDHEGRDMNERGELDPYYTRTGPEEDPFRPREEHDYGPSDYDI